MRITHVPTDIVVQCQNDRSQHRNRAEAMAMLKSKLYELELRKRQEEQQKLEDTKTDIGWGHQIRSYVLDQSRIKDLRTNYEVGNTQARARRRPRRFHRREPEAGSVTMPGAAAGALSREPARHGGLCGGLVTLATASLVASFLPARRVTRIDPVIALANE